jgi:hypothetical protein
MSFLRILAAAAIAPSLFLMGCVGGYVVKGEDRPLYQEEKIQTIAIRPFENLSAMPGVETWMVNQLKRRLQAESQVRVVETPDSADAVLSGSVLRSEAYVQNTASGGFSTLPGDVSPQDAFVLAAQYGAVLGVRFEFRKRSTGNVLWQGSMERVKSFTATNSFGVLGRTSPLLNESNLVRAIQDLTEQMALEAEEAMTFRF